MIYRFPEDSEDIQRDTSYNRIVFTNGCFDIVHPGHLRVIQRSLIRAACLNGVVVIGVNSDESVVRLKGPGRPVFHQWHRAGLLSMMRGVYMVVIYSDETPYELLRMLDPEVVLKGGDYTAEQVVVGPGCPEIEIVPTLEGCSTTAVIESLR